MSFFMRVVGNPFMKAILRSPLHPMMSKSVAVLSVSGMKSGKVYTFPVNYQRDGDEVWIMSMRSRTWWKNLRGGAKVIVRLMGRDFNAWGEVYEELQDVTHHLRDFILRSPAYGKYLKVSIDSDGRPNPEDLTKAAESRVIARITLSGN